MPAQQLLRHLPQGKFSTDSRAIQGGFFGGKFTDNVDSCHVQCEEWVVGGPPVLQEGSDGETSANEAGKEEFPQTNRSLSWS